MAVKISMDLTEVHRMFRQLPMGAMTVARNPLFQAADWVRGKAQSSYLRGPSPERLKIQTSRLFDSVHATVEPIASGKELVAKVKANAVSDGGFDYPAYWEWSGRKHGGPRPFLTPARDRHQDEWLRVFKTEFEKDFTAWERGKTY